MGKTLHKLDSIGLKNYAFIATLIDLRRRCWNRNRNRSISKRSSRFVLVRIELKRMPKVDWLREWCWPSLPDLSKIFICTLCSLTAPPPLGSLLSDPIAFAYDLQLVSRSLLGTCINWRRKLLGSFAEVNTKLVHCFLDLSWTRGEVVSTGYLWSLNGN